ncbi:HepT-like ribonuclease domain-containing protein [Campylobacter helveticus]|uniref:HepT-like ribonuclease domain-containing protein n=1 Tax=Campylobacter helveticus TaxID=28898 RepID=UPI001111BD68|nr:HepT-like ribonuclease domain-containing protein [Campylobacter helveticus]TNB61628.1 DUF86 domain-containing protein [Campylobacter helveticus]
MSENLKKLRDIKNRIDFIFELCEEGLVKALSDVKQKQPAIIMHLVVCNENLQKIQDNYEADILELFNKDDIRGLKAIRNIASHDYEGFNLAIIEEVIRYRLPPIREKIALFLERQDNPLRSKDILGSIEENLKEEKNSNSQNTQNKTNILRKHK